MKYEPKVCSRCQELKGPECFRIRTEKRRGGSWKYLNSTCRDCDKVAASIRHNALKNEEWYKQQARDRVKRYAKENWYIVREKDKIRRNTPEAKERHRQYLKDNKEKFASCHKAAKWKYHVKHRDQLTDNYIVGRLIGKSILARNEIPPALIELKRIEIQCIRTLKSISHEPQRTS